MATSGLYDSFLTFLLEGLRLVGWTRILIALLALVVIGALALWATSKVLCRGEKHLGAAISLPLMLVLIACMVGAIYLVTLLRTPTSNDFDAGTLLMASGSIAVVLLFLGVQGGFGASLPKSIVLTLVLLGSIGGAAYGLRGVVFGAEPPPLALLVEQVSGRTTQGPWLVESPEANKRIKVRRAPIETVQLEIRQNELLRVYQDLQAARAKLDVNDQAAVAAFNQRAAAYSTEVASVRSRLAEARALLAENSARELKLK